MKSKIDYKAKFLRMDSQTWLTIGILATIILVIFGIQSYLHPMFKILQTTCWNETTPAYNYTCMTLQNGSNVCGNVAIFIGDSEQGVLEIINKTEQKCSVKEVDEIKLICLNRIGNAIPCESIPNNAIKESEQKKLNGVNRRRLLSQNETNGDYYSYFIEFISKKDLTEKWLNENCECSDERMYIDYPCSQEDGSFKPLPDKCSKWKCGYYSVEIRQ